MCGVVQYGPGQQWTVMSSFQCGFNDLLFSHAGDQGERGDKGPKGYGLTGYTGDQGQMGNFTYCSHGNQLHFFFFFAKAEAKHLPSVLQIHTFCVAMHLFQQGLFVHIRDTADNHLQQAAQLIHFRIPVGQKFTHHVKIQKIPEIRVIPFKEASDQPMATNGTQGSAFRATVKCALNTRKIKAAQIKNKKPSSFSLKAISEQQITP